MAGYQFIHYEAYARQGNETKRSLIAIAQEADRDSGAHPHVITPQPPEYLLGTSFIDAAEQIVAAADESRVIHGGKPRKLRKDANVGIGLIASHPLSLNDLHALTETDRLRMIDEVKDWAESVVTFAQAEFPGLVKVAALHWDESHPHIHILIGSTEPTDDFQIIHKGEQARKRAQGNDRTGKGKKVGNDAYTKEMRRFQDRYHAEVSLHHGQARLGPNRRRLTRAQWRKEQAQAEALALAQRHADYVQHQIASDLAAAAEQAQLIVEATQEEAQRQTEKIERERRQAERQRQTAEAFKRKAEEEAQQAEELKQQAAQVKSVLDDRVRELSRYDGFFGRVLGWFGVRQRIERKAEAKLAQQLSSLRQQVETLSARVDRDAAIKQQHDHAIGALKALQRAISVSVEDYPVLKEKGALQGHFEYIQKLMDMNLPAERMKDEFDAHMDKLRADQYQSPMQNQSASSEFDY